MKTLWIALFLSLSAPVFAADFAGIAFERLSAELNSAGSAADKADSLEFYLKSLDRLDSKPKSVSACTRSIFSGSLSIACSPVARQGGTGGVD